MAGGFLTPAAVAVASGRPFQLGFADPDLAAESAASRDLWSARAVAGGASIARLNVAWAGIAPVSPTPGFIATDPSSPEYAWERLDASVRTAAAHGLRVLLTVQNAPRWAEGPGRPAGIKLGSWKPRAGAYGAFAQALAKRYNGHFPDPLVPGSKLPRVRYFEAWNEPNLVNFLAPQVTRDGRLVGPSMYRRLLNRFYAGVKKSQPNAQVLGSSFAPFGSPDGTITPPVLFLRNLLCLHGGQLHPTHCPEKAHIDIFSTHPIQVGPPTESAENQFDVTTPDLGRVTKVVHAAQRAGTVLPAGRKGLWVTEFWVDSDPPDPDGIPLAKQARWYEQDLYEYWLAGAEAAIELQLHDYPPGPGGYASTLQSGIYFLDGQPKPSQTAMRFPFVARRSSRDQVSFWGIAPKHGKVQVQARRRGAWRTLAMARADGFGHPFTATLRLRGRAQLRATIGKERSLVWRQG